MSLQPWQWLTAGAVLVALIAYSGIVLGLSLATSDRAWGIPAIAFTFVAAAVGALLTFAANREAAE